MTNPNPDRGLFPTIRAAVAEWEAECADVAEWEQEVTS